MSEHVVFGIRHHGPGSARSLLRALESMRPDAVLIEGPPDAEEVLPLAAHGEMQPPVALLVYDADSPRRCAFYPFAEFSPEWQALRYALASNLPVQFMDLPQKHVLALRKQAEEKAAEEAAHAEPGENDVDLPGGDKAVIVAEREESSEGASGEPDVGAEDSLEIARRDPLRLLAEAAGYTDSERWWEHLVEEREGADEVFGAINEAMTALRSELLGDVLECESEREATREAWMRKTIRSALKEGHERVAVVCGAWHAPALVLLPPASKDNALLKGLPKLKTQAAWIPWTYGRLARASGYGAGVISPGWYDFLWNAHSSNNGDVERDVPLDRRSRDIAAGWLVKVAGLFRSKDINIAPSHVIESVRLAESLSALRGRPVPGLPEMNEATQTVMLFGDATSMRLVQQELVIGERLGEVPEEAPLVPLQQDLQRLQKTLRLRPAADSKDMDFDLRKPMDLSRSQLLHRLRLLGIPWGEPKESEIRGKGTFRESWTLQWQPEFAVRLIEAVVWGNTVESAASAFAIHEADKADGLVPLTQLVGAVLLANLPDAIRRVMERLDAEAAVAGDVGHMMDAVAPLARVLRYGNVRGVDGGMVSHVVEGLVVRICIGLGDACYSLDDEAAAEMFGRIAAVDSAIRTIENPGYLEQWTNALLGLLESESLHGLVAGRVCRILLDGSAMEATEAGRRMGLALSRGNDPLQGGAWVEGFLQGSGMVLLHSPNLWSILDDWVCEMGGESFTEVLPLLRRTFSTFPRPERRMMGERVKNQPRGAGRTSAPGDEPEASINEERAAKVLPILEALLGPEE